MFSTVILGADGPGCEALDEDDFEDLSADESHLHGIVNGVLDESDEFDGVVAVRNNGGICTGTLIDSNVVLTAAHCVHSSESNHVATPAEVTVHGGLQREELLATATEIIVHPSWLQAASGKRADIAVIILDEPVEEYSQYCLRRDDSYGVGTQGIIVGYGRESSEGTSGIKRYGETTILKKTAELIEIGNPTGTCLGDSGGPLFTLLPSGEYAVVGVSSFGDGACNPEGNAYEVKILPYREWISSIALQYTGRSLLLCLGDAVVQADIFAESDGDATDGSSQTGADSEPLGEASGENDVWDDTENYFEEGMGCTAAGQLSNPHGSLSRLMQLLY